MTKLSVEYSYIKLNSVGRGVLTEDSIFFRNIGEMYPYTNKDDTKIITVSDYDGVWKSNVFGCDSWKDNPDVSLAFEHVIGKSDEFHLVTSRTRSKKISFLPFFSDDQIDEIKEHAKKINPECKLFVRCGLDKVFKGNVFGDIVTRKIDDGCNVAALGSSFIDRRLIKRVSDNLGDKRQNLTYFDTGHWIV